MNLKQSLFILCCFIPLFVLGQTVEIKGLVLDQNNEPIIGATVEVLNNDKTVGGTITDIDGIFMLEASSDAKIRIKYVGFKTKVIPIKGKRDFKISLEDESKLLDEVVVVGYGIMKKSDLTGSVSKIGNDKSEEKGYTTMENMLQGKVAGVQITQNSGALGGGMSFSIRGSSSITGSNQPLIVIDGYPIESGNTSVSIGGESSYQRDQEGQNMLASLNPNDIESIEILKDASSTAIYGSRGANGVVLITTKSGKEGKTKIDYNYRIGVSHIRKTIDVLNTQEFIAFSNEAFMDKRNGDIAYSQNKIDELKGVDTNWQDLIYQNGISQNHQISLAGGGKGLSYSLSLGYLSQSGVVKNTSFDRGTLRTNIKKDINKKIKIGLNINGSLSSNHAVNQSSSASAVDGSVVTSALLTAPFYSPSSDDDITDSNFTNPLILVEEAEDVNKKTQINVMGTFDYKILPELSLNIRAGINSNDYQRNYYMPRGTYKGDQSNGYAYEGYKKSFDYIAEYILNYQKTFSKKHSLNLMGAYSWQEWKTNSFGIGATGFINDDAKYYNIGSAQNILRPANNTIQSALSSFLGRINYNYDNRYLFTVSARYDGSTRLAPGHKWALFPSMALGWNVHNEKFLKDISWISQLKLRASYGVSGNQTIGVGSTVSKYKEMTGVVNEGLIIGFVPSNMQNENLSWEMTRQYNIGLDWGFMANRFKLSLDLYRKMTSDLLINLPLPSSTGYSSYATNAGKVMNKGLEIEAFADILQDQFKWSVNGNISFNRNEVIEFNGDITNFSGPTFPNLGGQSPTIAMINQPIGVFYGYKIIGIYQNQEEIDNHAKDPANPRPGDFKFADISGPEGKPDGVISDYDKTIIGNPYPDFVFGLTNNFSYKNLSLSIFVMGNIGQDILNGNRFQLDALSRSTTKNVSREAYENRWTGEGTSNYYPAARSMVAPFMGRVSDFIVEDGSFVRLKNVTLSYSIPLKRKYVRDLRFFISGDNLLTWTKYKGYDPEINGRGSNSLTQGIDLGSIPQFMSFSGGFNIGF